MTKSIYTVTIDGKTVGTRTSTSGLVYTFAVVRWTDGVPSVESYHSRDDLAHSAVSALHGSAYYANRGRTFSVRPVEHTVKVAKAQNPAQVAATRRGVIGRQLVAYRRSAANSAERIAHGPIQWMVEKDGVAKAEAYYRDQIVAPAERDIAYCARRIAELEAERAAPVGAT
jgi:hypothetical protein